MCVASAKTITVAQMAKKALASAGIFSTVVSVDPNVTKRGCSYGISFRCSERERVYRILTAEKIPFGEILPLGGGR